MPVNSLYDYVAEPLDAEPRFGGPQIVYMCWDKHLMFANPGCVPVPRDMTFKAFLENVIEPAYSSHPDWEKIKWDEVEWLLDNESFNPSFGKGLREQGIGHKSIVRFRTPELDGIKGSCS